MRQADAVERARRIAEDARRPDLDGGRTPEAPAPPSPPRSLKVVPPPQRRAVRDAAFVRELGLLDVAALRRSRRATARASPSPRPWAFLVEALGDAPAVSRADAARAAPARREAAARRQRGARRRAARAGRGGVSDDGTSTRRAPAPGPGPRRRPRRAPPRRRRPRGSGRRAARAHVAARKLRRFLCDRVRIDGSARALGGPEGARSTRGSTTCSPSPAGSRAPHRAADQGGLGRRRGVVQGGPAAAPAAAPARVDTRRAARRSSRRTSGRGARSAPRSRRKSAPSKPSRTRRSGSRPT